MTRALGRPFSPALGALALTIALVGPVLPASAAAFCGMRNDMALELERDHGEVPVYWGVIGGTHIVEVFAAPAGTFTILVTRPDGLACVMAAGDDLQVIEKRPKDGPV